MSITTMTDRPGLDASKFSASLIETPGRAHRLTVSGEAIGDYRVQRVTLVPAKYQESEQTLVLQVEATLGPVENPHPETERVLPLHYVEKPAARKYVNVLIVNGKQRFTVKILDVL